MSALDRVFQDAETTTLTFDCYGTLVDWEGGAAAALRDIYGYSTEFISQDALIKLFLEFDALEIRKNIFPYTIVLQNVADRIAERLLGRIDPGRGVQFAQSLPKWPVFGETNKALKQLAKQFRLAIISNVDKNLISQTLQNIDVTFDAVVTSEQTRSYKPDLSIFEQAIRQLGEDPGRIVHVAEGLCEAVPAAELGMRSVWIKRSALSDDGSGATPNATANCLAEVVLAARSSSK
ncbi:MAG: HAD-IA family hydrolase [Rhizobiales bacterium]|nr:HAD-IA family hydrolase [Hyphomicrobiales bacterium]